MGRLRAAGRGILMSLAVAATAPVTACSAPMPPPRPVATPMPYMVCSPDAQPNIVPGAVPPGFDPVAAVTCGMHEIEKFDDGIWIGTRAITRTGDLRPLLAALAVPDEPPSDGPCPAIAFAGPTLWLRGAGHTFVPVAYPADACGLPRTEAVFAALDALTVVADDFEPTEPVG